MAASVIAAILLAVGGLLYWRSLNPEAARLARGSGVAMLRAARYEEAVTNFTRAIDLETNDAETYRLRGQARLALFDLDAALSDFTEVCKLRPTEAGAFIERGGVLFKLRQSEKALADAATAIQLNPNHSPAYELRGQLLRDQGKFTEALEEFSRAIQYTPNLGYYIERAQTYQALDRHDLAIADLDKAIELDPDQPHTYYARATSRTALGDRQGAAEDTNHGRAIDGLTEENR